MTDITPPNITEENDPSIEIKSYNLHKVTRKGDKIYYSKPENITNLENHFSGERKDLQYNENSVEDKNDDSESRESFCKTFSFETNNDETKKCIAFWRSVVEKNLQPMKCTIIESLKEQQDTMTKTQATVKENDSMKTKRKGKGKVKSKEKKKNGHSEKDDEKSMLVEILKELQKKRLQEVRLIAKKRCSFCEAPTADLDDHKKEMQKELKRDLKDLNKFEPKYNPNTERSATNEIALRYAKTKKTANRLNVQQNSSRNKEKDQNGRDNQMILDNNTELENKSKISETQIASIKKESEKFRLVDAISSKQESGAYSKWRGSKAEGSCKCASEYCRCNTNPAIISFKQQNNIEGKISKEFIISEPKMEVETEKVNTESEVEPKPKEDTNNGLDLNTRDDGKKNNVKFKSEIQAHSEEDEVKTKALRKENNLGKHEIGQEDEAIIKDSFAKDRRSLVTCTCGEKDCDCKENIEFAAQKNKIKETLNQFDEKMPDPDSEVLKKRSESGRNSYNPICRKISASASNLGKYRLSTVSADSQGNAQLHTPSEDYAL